MPGSTVMPPVDYQKPKNMQRQSSSNPETTMGKEKMLRATEAKRNGNVRNAIVAVAAEAKRLSETKNRPADVQEGAAQPILNTVGMLKTLRNAMEDFYNRPDCWPDNPYDASPGDCLNVIEMCIDELNKALENVWDIEDIAKQHQTAVRQ